MARIVLAMSMSLDGFLAGHSDEYGAEAVGESMSTGAVITGRRAFDRAVRWNDHHHDGVPGYVLTLAAPDGDSPGAAQYVTDVESAVTRAKAAAGDRDVLVRGTSTAQELLRLGLVDAMEIHLVHVLLGQGRRLFDELEPDHLELRLIRTLQASGVTHLHFAVDDERRGRRR